MMNIPSTEARVLDSFDDERDRFLPEGPRCLTVEGREALIWVNIQTAADATGGTIHLRFWDNGERRDLPQAARPGFVMPTDRPGFVVVGREKEIGLLDLRSNEWTAWATIPDKNPRTIINDGEIVQGGKAIVFGTKDVRFADPIAHLYLFTVDDRKITILADKQTCSNGKILMKSGFDRMLFDIDTPKRTVVRYFVNLERRILEDVRKCIDLKSIEGFPDGMVNTGWDTFIIAFYNPSRGGTGRAIHFHLESERIIEEWTTPGSPRVTCPLLFERDGKVQLVLTTAVEGMPAEMRAQSPNAGNLFIADVTLEERLPRAEVVRIG